MSDFDDTRGYTITRVFDAPREAVWAAWTEPDQFAQWFGGPDSHLEDVVTDARDGGEWRADMVLANGHRIPWRGKYLEVDPPSRLRLAFADFEPLGDVYDVFTVTLTDLGGKTELVLRQSGGHLTDEQYEQAREGTASFLDRMAVLVEGR